MRAERKTMGRIVASCASALVLVAAAAAAQDPGSRQTREFVQAAAQSDQFEIQEALTVLTQSTDPQVRGFAQQMIREHDRLSGDLLQATSRAGLKPPPMGLGDDQAKLLGALQSLTGAELDKTYAQHQALAHRSTLVVDRQYAATGDVPGLKQLASSAASVVAAHLAMAEQMQAKLGSP